MNNCGNKQEIKNHIKQGKTAEAGSPKWTS
jgi:hypothetical protein